ncbi:hypothetical protein [Alterisphingorhabdus coralli]|uniref:Lipoprotein n=1 Tax=Alterisphingorhabdus coralli TaxID=3071408 RepID=A0AA97F9V5_9SPHN|nr:hypothetical protein [Parasphingorhabdus sp. SCSIO 66989]WOE75717.1 hypothetical protein RB602_03115 [Parasphingorhabdus sp. SCSIO 66989]
MALRQMKFGVIAVLTAIVAACTATAPPPVVVAPKPPPVFVPPPQPVPPMGATASMAIPPVGADGLRLTPNRGIGPLETLWHFRAAYNVAALNCQDSIYLSMADEYNQFLKTHRRELTRANRAIESKYRRDHGGNYRRVRDTHSTRVYNFFALPPVRKEFCNNAYRLGQQASTVPSAELVGFAATALPELESIFNRFFTAYEQYERDLAAWNATYGQGAQRMQAADGMNGTLGQPMQSNPFGPTAPTTAAPTTAAPTNTTGADTTGGQQGPQG